VLKASAVFIFIQQIFFVSKAKWQMFYARKRSGRYRRLHLSSRDKCDFGSFSVGVQTPTEIGELRLRTSLPVKTPE